jgi:hypothetical protein
VPRVLNGRQRSEGGGKHVLTRPAAVTLRAKALWPRVSQAEAGAKRTRKGA